VAGIGSVEQERTIPGRADNREWSSRAIALQEPASAAEEATHCIPFT